MKKPNKLLLLAVFLFFVQKVLGQTAVLSGVTMDEENKPLGFASIALLKLPDSSQAASATSNEKGEFFFRSISKGEYLIAAFQVGYAKTLSEKIICDGSSRKHISLVLKSASVETQEITIQGQKPLVRQEPDKMVVDVENSVSNSGLTTLDVLRKSPGVSVGKDGNISIKGKGGVLVMLDDKPMYMSESELANLLKSIPSDQLKEIEIITSPSAKYDAAGSSGIINIRLKKAAYEGLTSSLNASYGQGFYYKTNAGANIAYKKKKLTLNTGYQFNNNKDMEKEEMNRNYLDPTNPYKYLHSSSFASYFIQSHSGLFNGEYKLHKNHTLSFDFTGSGRNGEGEATTNTDLLRQSGELGTSTYTQGKGIFGGSNLGLGGGYKAKLDTNGTLLSFYANYNRNEWHQERKLNTQYFDSLGQETQLPYLFTQQLKSVANQYSFKTDFTKQLSKIIKLETGAKLNANSNQYPNTAYITQNGIQNEYPTKFTYKEQVYAAYGMLNGKWQKWKAQAGLRMEHTQVDAYQESTDSAFARTYTNLFPSGNISYSPTKMTTFSLLYSRRIKRPEAHHLNPVPAVQDPFTSWGGNPYLLPQYSDNFELAYSVFGGALITTLSYSHNSNHISYVMTTVPNTLRTRSTYMNMKRRDMAGISFTLNAPINRWWTTSNFVNLFYTKFEGGEGYENMNFEKGAWTANSTQTLQLSKKLTLELSGNYESPKAQNAFGINLETWQLNAGLSQKFWSGKGVAKIAISDIFWKSRWATESTVNNTIISNSEISDTRVLMFTFTYKFGNKVRIINE